MTQSLLIRTMFLALAIGFISCKGQVNQEQPKEKISAPPIISEGQPKLIKTQGSSDGENVHDGLQDQAGNLWFGTTGEGVYVYDGQSFTQFTVADGLYSNTVWCMFEDRDGRIWIGTSAGLNFYNGQTFEALRVAPQDEKESNKYDVFSILQDKKGQLWFATVNGVYFYDGQSFEKFIIHEGAKGFMSDKHNVEHILEDKDGNIWFGGRVNSGVFRYDGKTIVNFPLAELSGHDWAWPALEDKNGDIWFTNWGGTYRYDGESITTFTKKDGLCDGAITRIIEDKKGNLWFGSSGGVCRYDGISFTHFTTEDGLPHNGVWTILEDRNGYIWVGTRDTGLSRYDGNAFASFSEKEESSVFDQSKR